MSVVTYTLSRPSADTLRLNAHLGQRQVIGNAEMHMPGRTPAQLATACHRLAQSHLLLSSPSRVTSAWGARGGEGVPLWKQFRDVIASLPRGPSPA